jgi:hypothetical protein
MRISGEGTAGLIVGLLALGGGGAIMVAPEQLWIGWSLIVVAAFGGVALFLHHYSFIRKAIMTGAGLAILGTILIVSGSILGLIGALKIDSAQTRPLLTDEPSLLTLFMNLLRPMPGSIVNGFTEDNTTGDRVYYNIYYDFRSNSKYLAFYVPHNIKALSVIRDLAIGYKPLISSVDGTINFDTKALGNTSSVATRNYFFSGAIYIFHEDTLSLKELSDLSEVFNNANVTPQFYSTDFKLIEQGQIKLGHFPKMAVYEMQNGIIQPVFLKIDR